MKNGRLLEYHEIRYNEIKDRLLKNNREFSEQVFGGRKTIFLNSQMTASMVADAGLVMGDITKRQFMAFLGMFNRVMYQQFKKNKELLSLKIEFKGVSRKKNNLLWDRMNYGTMFYNLDLSSAYWQIAYRLGYITEKVYLNYIDKDEYKEVKRYCISFLGRVNKKKYISNTGEEYEIRCDMTPLQTVYDNIRNELYKTINEIAECLPEVLEQNIDGITVLLPDYKKTKELLAQKGLKFKVTQCIKMNDFEYFYGSKPRAFKKIPKVFLEKVSV
jgi:hypothetical protein